jgi:hypothetical protein
MKTPIWLIYLPSKPASKRLSFKNDITTFEKAMGWVSEEVVHRTWVGLTDEETDHLFNIYERSSFGLVHAVEAKLKEKNA